LDRRSFVKVAGLGAAALSLNQCTTGQPPQPGALVIATWKNTKAVQAAWDTLKNQQSALDAVEQGARVPEADPDDRSVGYGGHADETGAVTLDASIMDGQGNCGAVAMAEGILHPVSLARIVMEKTPHILIVGDGCRALAEEHGIPTQNMLSPESAADYEKWFKENKPYEPFHEPGESHDTIGILAIDDQGKLAGACSTSGMGYKKRGRVGDAPIIGAGLFVDDEVGAATATGTGEEMIRIAGAHLIVEHMRLGVSPQKACETAVDRVIRRYGDKAKDIMVCFLAINNQGEIGAWSTTPGFEYTVMRDGNEMEVIKSGSVYR